MTHTLGGMEILGEISAGGMGAVLLARRVGAHGFEKLVAIKTIRPELAERGDIRELFNDEARLVARIVHPAVTQVHDFGEEAGTLYLAMEYVQGVSLDLLLEKLGALPPGIAAQVAQQACRGLHAAHQLTDSTGRSLSVVHRDVTPSNLMLTFDGGVKILDFGIALMRDRRAPITEVGRVRGKIAYLAPEQIAGETVDRRTDVWGIANVLFEMLSGHRLRGDLELSEIAEELERPPPSLGPLIPAELGAIVTQGLARRPAERFRDAREMARRLEDAIKEIGGESLEDFALRELEEEREKHQQKLTALLQGDPHEPRKKRGPTLVASGATPPPEIPKTRLVRKRPRLFPVAIAGAAFGLVLALASIPSREPQPSPPPFAKAEPSEPVNEPEPQPEPDPAPDPIKPKRKAKPHAAPQPPPPTFPTSLGHGWLTIGAHPYALVVVDGRELGVTPLLKLKLETGTHELRLLDPATRALRQTRTIAIQDGRHERITIK